MKWINIAATLAVLGLAVACSNGGDSDFNTDGGAGSIAAGAPSPGGYWNGTLLGNSVEGVITETGGGILYDATNKVIYRLRMTVNVNGSFTAAVSRLANNLNGSALTTGALSNGSLVGRNSMMGTVTLGTSSGSLSLTYNATKYVVPTTFSDLVGTYTFPVSATEGLPVTFDANGNITIPGDTNGACSGRASFPSNNYAVFTFALGSSEDCFGPNQNGIAFYDVTNHVLTVELDAGNDTDGHYAVCTAASTSSSTVTGLCGTGTSTGGGSTTGGSTTGGSTTGGSTTGGSTTGGSTTGGSTTGGSTTGGSTTGGSTTGGLLGGLLEIITGGGTGGSTTSGDTTGGSTTGGSTTGGSTTGGSATGGSTTGGFLGG